MAFKLRPDLLKMIKAEQDALLVMVEEAETLLDSLRGAYEGLKDQYEDRSERWQEGERGEATSQWLDELESLISEFEEFADSARQQADALGDIREEPEY